LYIHGFASSPDSRKAQAIWTALEAKGIILGVPAMDEGDFEHLTISGQLAVLDRTLNDTPAHLIGSSMGGYLAALYASAHPEIARLVLLAPAFDFARRWNSKAQQTQTNAHPPASFDVYHYGEKRMRQVHARLIEEALEFPTYPSFPQPALIFHGIHDETVPIENSRRFAAGHANVRLIELESDHELLNVLEPITAETVKFLLPNEAKTNA
jgi:hypothetical protein